MFVLHSLTFFPRSAHSLHFYYFFWAFAWNNKRDKNISEMKRIENEQNVLIKLIFRRFFHVWIISCVFRVHLLLNCSFFNTKKWKNIEKGGVLSERKKSQFPFCKFTKMQVIHNEHISLISTILIRFFLVMLNAINFMFSKSSYPPTIFLLWEQNLCKWFLRYEGRLWKCASY